MASSPTVQYVSDCFIKPLYDSEESKKPVYLSSWDLAMLSFQYIQKGLLFTKPSSFQLDPLLRKLKESLSITLVHFYLLACRFKTLKQENPPLYTVFIDCVNSPGARFIHANLDSTVTDILSPKDVPLVVQSFFDHDRAINHDGHDLSLLTIQLTELIDGVFIGCSVNHAVADGSSFWHFFNSFSEVFKANNGQKQSIPISKSPNFNHWFPEGHSPIINLPYTHHDQFTSRHEAPNMRERFFHFSAESLKKLKAKANQEFNSNINKISSLQALSAHMWRCITRVRKFPSDQMTSCGMLVNNRARLDPPLPENYFGNCIQTVRRNASVGKLLENNLGWAAWELHQAVVNHKNKEIREWVEKLECGVVYQLGSFCDPCSIVIGSSPRFDMYGNEFGFGKGVALRSGYAHKFDGKVSLYEGIEGDGSMDLEVCLLPDFMASLETDKGFMDSLSS
ncbi:uncharacterized acetyltransferase At3g50280-like [Solanum tuberosum]|uniref:Anthranilate N-benzoyltransferase protein n=1 Tax=Solanum tuberosum TaxID=4113 RepID=M1D815_SOLTU|nr:PREDICTED: uncharacterized acetyltransferase At3g50280-like [Solanum tuberosum]